MRISGDKGERISGNKERGSEVRQGERISGNKERGSRGDRERGSVDKETRRERISGDRERGSMVTVVTGREEQGEEDQW